VIGFFGGEVVYPLLEEKISITRALREFKYPFGPPNLSL